MKPTRPDLSQHLLLSQLLHCLPFLLALPPHSNQLHLLALPWPLQFDGLHYWLNDYHYEPNFAFLPAYPSLLAALRWLLSPTAALWAVVLLNRALFVVSAVKLQRILLLLGCSRLQALSGAVVFLYGPASVFFHAVYTESIFVCLSWLALEQLLTNKSTVVPTGLLSLCVWIRSNGLFLSAVGGLELVSSAVQGSWRQRMKSVGEGVASLTVLCAGLGLHCWRGYEKFCGSGECVANVYSYVQAKYWQVGLFRYWQPHNALFIAIGLPAFFPVIHSLFHWPAGASIRHHGLYLSLAILFLVTLCMTNLQSATRFFSSHPLFYLGIVRLGSGARCIALLYCFAGLALFPAGFPWT